MKFLSVCLFCLFIFSCGPGERTDNSGKPPHTDTTLVLPDITSGMTVDTSLPSIRISSLFTFTYTDTTGVDHQWPDLLVEMDSLAHSDVVNVYVNERVESRKVDSVLDIYCPGKDLRLIGLNNGEEVAIPFHTLHRFPSRMDTIFVEESDFHVVFVDHDEISVNDWSTRYRENLDYYFRTFYGDAFNPVDSSIRFPHRKTNRQTVPGLMAEGQAWDERDIKSSPDSAQMLAAYNEFVNKLEVYDKVGSFCTLRAAVMEIDVIGDVSWGRLLNLFATHYDVQQALRKEAKKYLADKIATEGGDPNKSLTEEDLRLLYPDRLRWNGRISGMYEHRYDPTLLATWGWAD